MLHVGGAVMLEPCLKHRQLKYIVGRQRQIHLFVGVYRVYVIHKGILYFLLYLNGIYVEFPEHVGYVTTVLPKNPEQQVFGSHEWRA